MVPHPSGSHLPPLPREERLVALIACIGDNPLDDAFAKRVAEVLVPTYPNHSWWVECRQGVLIIKHMEASGARGLIGMLRKLDQLPQGSAALHKEIVRAGGELLERAHLARGPRTEEPVKGFELDDAKMHKYWHAPVQQKLIH